MSFKDVAKSHFRAQLDGAPRTVAVPEWGEEGKPLVIHFRPMNMLEKDKVFQKYQAGSLAANVTALIVRARDGDGKKLFTEADAHELMREYDPDVIGRIVNEMNAADQAAKAALPGE